MSARAKTVGVSLTPSNYTPGSSKGIEGHLEGIDVVLASFAPLPARTLIVAPSGGDYTTISDAITAAIALTPTAASPVLIKVAAGSFTEDISIPAYVTVQGMGSHESTILHPSVATATCVTLVGNAVIERLKIDGASGSGGIGIEFSGSGWAHVHDVEVENCETAIQTDNGVSLHLQHVEVAGTCTTHIATLNASDEVFIQDSTVNERRLSITVGSDIHGSFYSEEANEDRAFVVFDEFHVGSRLVPAASNFGEGDSTYDTMAVLTNTNAEAGTWTDRTTEAISQSGSAFVMFPGTAANNCLFIGGDFKFTGIKFYQTVGALPSDNDKIVVEYWNGSSWTTLNVMQCSAIGGGDPTQYGKQIFRAVGAHNSRWNPPSNWATKTLTSDPSGYGAKYWVRVRVTTTLVSATRALEYTKLHVNSHELNVDGRTEYFGAARPLVRLPLAFTGKEQWSGFTPGNQNLAYSTNITLIATLNIFTGTAKTGIGGRIILPKGIDTSMPVTLTAKYYTPATVSLFEAIEFESIYRVANSNSPILIITGNLMDGTESDTALTNVITGGLPDGPVANELTDVSFTYDISSAYPNSEIAFVLFRDGTVGNGDDTYAGNVNVVQLSAFGYLWRA